MGNLTWKKHGVRGRFDGIRNRTTGELRPPTWVEVDRFIAEFEGPQYLEPPFTFFAEADHG